MRAPTRRWTRCWRTDDPARWGDPPLPTPHFRKNAIMATEQSANVYNLHALYKDTKAILYAQQDSRQGPGLPGRITDIRVSYKGRIYTQGDVIIGQDDRVDHPYEKRPTVDLTALFGPFGMIVVDADTPDLPCESTYYIGHEPWREVHITHLQVGHAALLVKRMFDRATRSWCVWYKGKSYYLGAVIHGEDPPGQYSMTCTTDVVYAQNGNALVRIRRTQSDDHTWVDSKSHVNALYKYTPINNGHLDTTL